MKINKYIGILLSLILILTPFLLFPVCDSLKPDGTHMGCFYSGVLIMSMGIIIFLLQFMKKFNYLRIISSMILSVLCWLIPNKIINISFIGLCADYEHSCRASTMPAVGIIVILLVIIFSCELIINFIGGRK